MHICHWTHSANLLMEIVMNGFLTANVLMEIMAMNKPTTHCNGEPDSKNTNPPVNAIRCILSKVSNHQQSGL